MNLDPAQIITALAVFIPALLGALKTFKNSSDADKRLKALEDWQKLQDDKLSAIKADTEKGFREQGQHRSKLDRHLALIEDRMRTSSRRLESIPTRSEFGYRRDQTLELTPLPTVAPQQPPLDEPPDYPGLDEDFKPKRKKR
jgi:hypothetical protein